MKVLDAYNYIDGFAPFCTKAQWDNSGLLVGDLSCVVTGITVCLDVTEDVLKAASENGCNLIISHHPVIFREVRSFLSDSLAYKAVSMGISIISAHTNFDKAPDGVNDILCKTLGIRSEKCSSEIAEGFLNVGTFQKEYSAFELAEHISKCLGGAVKYCDSKRPVTRVAVCSGSGDDFIAEALSLGCDGYITGEASYHKMLDAKEQGISVFAAGHFETEIGAVKELTERLRNSFTGLDIYAFIPESPVSAVK